MAAAIPLDPMLRVVAPTGMLASSTFEYVQGPAPWIPLPRAKYRLSYSGEVHPPHPRMGRVTGVPAGRSKGAIGVGRSGHQPQGQGRANHISFGEQMVRP